MPTTHLRKENFMNTSEVLCDSPVYHSNPPSFSRDNHHPEIDFPVLDFMLLVHA